MITIACSSDLIGEANVLSERLRAADSDADGVVFCPKPDDSTSDRSAVDRMNCAIASSVCLYVLAPCGVVGRVMAAHIGYARAYGVPVYTSSELVDESLAYFTSGMLPPDDFVEYMASR